MSQQPETRFTCDRCKHVVSLPLNEQPAQERGKPPKDWLMMHLDGATAPPSHLCPECHQKFLKFMND